MMFSFHSLLAMSAATTLLSASSSNAETLRSLTARHLSLAPIAGFEPTSSVTDHNAIDLDQQTMEQQLGEGTDLGFANAQRIYEEGGNSKSYATLTLSTALSSMVAKDYPVSGGLDTTGKEVVGKALEDAAAGSTTLKVQYSTSEVQASWSDCRVGGLPDPVTDGCYADSGEITVDGASYAYNYTLLTDNDNDRTIQGFSKKADEKMRVDGVASGPYYYTFQKFINFYGVFDFADKIVSAAFAGVSVTLNNKVFDFSAYGFDGKAEVVKKGAAYMNTALYVIRELEDALDDCAAQETKRNDDSVHALDEAVAFYTGSLEGTDGAGSGVHMYAVAEKRCVDFKTCGTNGNAVEGNAVVNDFIFQEFDLMQQNLGEGLCPEARRNKEEIETKMFVPLVQGTLRYAWKKANDAEAAEKEEAEGAAFAAAVLPVVARCSENDADIIFNSMKPGSGFDIDHAEIKSAFERNYGCMGITCRDVGGLYDDANAMYYAGAAPCEDDSNTANVGAIVGGVVGGIFALGLIVFLVKGRRSSKGDVEFGSGGEQTTV